MTNNNGTAGRIGVGGTGGRLLDRQFGPFLVMHDGGAGEVAVDVERVVSIKHGQGETAGGKVNVTVVALAGEMHPTFIASRGVVDVTEAIARAKEKWATERQSARTRAKISELNSAWFELGERVRAQLRAWAEEQRIDDEARQQARMAQHDTRCPDCRAKAQNTCCLCDGPLDPSRPSLPPMRFPSQADVADVEGRAARAAAAGGGSGILGTSIAGAGLAPGPLGPADNPHIDSIERTGEIAGTPTDPDDQAAAIDEAAQKALGANADPLDPNATG